MSDLEIAVVSRKFDLVKYPDLQSEKIYKCQFSDLVWAAISVGKREQQHIWQHGYSSHLEVQWRRIMLSAFLEMQGKKLHLSDAFRSLDGSEKTAISYFIGLVAAKFVAEQALGISWLLHLDVYRAYLNYVVTSDPSPPGSPPRNKNQEMRPDLVGRNFRDQWFAFEAKGRSGPLDNTAMVKAKKQARTLTSVKGKKPELNIASQSYFRKSGLTIKWEDPPTESNEGWQLEVSDDDFFRRYYHPTVAAIGQSETIREFQGRTYLTTPIIGTDVLLGLDTEVLDSLRGGANWSAVTENLHFSATTNRGEEQRGLDLRQEFPNTTVGGDGILVELREMREEINGIKTIESGPNSWICFAWPTAI